jgi:hypothetical protein
MNRALLIHIVFQVRNLEREHGWRGFVHGVPVDAPQECSRALRRLSAETGGRFSPTEGFLLRERLLYEGMAGGVGIGAGADGPYAEAEILAGCAPATAADPQRMRCGRADGAGLAVPPQRRVALMWRGEAEAPSGGGGVDGMDGFSRGLRVVAYSGDWAAKLDRTFDTWGRCWPWEMGVGLHMHAFV